MNILLIDEDEDCLDSLVSALESAGHWCDKFTLPGEAMEAYGQNQYEVVIADLNMPGMSGMQILKQIRYLNPEAKVIISAGQGDLGAAVAAINNGAYAFFVKPADLLVLIETIEGIELEITEQMLILNMPGWLGS